MSTKNSLKDRIKKPNATQAFFNSYDNNEDEVLLNNNDKENNKEEINNHNNNDKKIDNNINNEVDDKTYVNNDNKVDNVSTTIIDDDDDYLRELATGKKPIKKKNKKVFTSFYMDPDLAIEVEKIASRGEKGDKSKLINKGIRKLLEDYGVIEKNRS